MVVGLLLFTFSYSWLHVPSSRFPSAFSLMVLHSLKQMSFPILLLENRNGSCSVLFIELSSCYLSLYILTVQCIGTVRLIAKKKAPSRHPSELWDPNFTSILTFCAMSSHRSPILPSWLRTQPRPMPDVFSRWNFNNWVFLFCILEQHSRLLYISNGIDSDSLMHPHSVNGHE